MSAEPAPSGPVPCARHRNVETLLRCSRCGTPICPKCLVHSPVGARCPDCASPLRVVGPSRTQFLLAGIAGGGIGMAGGALLAIAPLGGFGGIGLLLVGLVVGEVVSRAANRRGGTPLALVAFVSAFSGPILGRAALFAAMTPVADPALRGLLALTVVVQAVSGMELFFLIIAGIVASTRAH